MRANKPRRPEGRSPEAIFAQAVWDLLWGGGLAFVDSPTIKFSSTTGGISAKAKATLGGAGKWRWATPKLYNKALDYQADEIALVIPSNDVVVSGHLDPDTEETVFTQACLWICLKPPRVAIPETDPVEYAVHTPQWPLPDADNPDGADTYWYPISFYPLCVT